MALDVTDPAVAREAVQAAMDEFGALDVVVNNAGYATSDYEPTVGETNRYRRAVDGQQPGDPARAARTSPG